VLIVLNKQRHFSRERYGSNRRYYVSSNLITWSRVPLRHPYRSHNSIHALGQHPAHFPRNEERNVMEKGRRK
jgi:hypothetical protein